MLDFVETETLLVKTFGDLIRDMSLSVNDNLREKGLDSLQCVAGAMLLRKHGIRVKPQDLVKYETVRALANHLCHAQSAADTEAQLTTQSALPFPMTPTQRDWQKAGFNEHYSIYGGWAYHKGALSTELFAKSVQQLVTSQDELRLRISHGADGLEFSCASHQKESYLETIDLSHLTLKQAQSTAVQTCHDLQRAFVFDGQAPLCRFINFQLDQSGNGWIFIIVHHFAVDGFGWGNLLRKLSYIYSRIGDGLDPRDVFGGSGVSRDWSHALKEFGKSPDDNELPYWKSLPWDELNRDLLGSKYCDNVTAPENVFNDKDAARLHDLSNATKVTDAERMEIFKSQATVIATLDADFSRRLLEHQWHNAGQKSFDDFDLFSAAMTRALAPYCQAPTLLLDMLAATRSGVFDDIDASGSLGYFSELTPFVVPVAPQQDLHKTAQAIARFRAEQPRSGVGFRALKTYAVRPEYQSAMQAMKLPMVGINYHASLLYNFSGTLLDLPKVSDWLGPTMDENGIRYRFWSRVSFTAGRLEMVLRYDPKLYCVEDGLAVANGTISALREFLAGT